LPRADADARLASAARAIATPIAGAVYGQDDDDLAALVLEEFRAAGRTIAVAESCTGGLLGARLTSFAGSSAVVLGGVIAYANDVKEQQLGVTRATLERAGAVSDAAAREMASGVRNALGADVGVAITGIAGPGGATERKPVGTVFVAVATATTVHAEEARLVGDRQEIRQRATQLALMSVRKVG
jgi:nicotinamide-nucleotide amidase